ncbi:MAG: histidine--tRNA ligase [Phycisphaerales bacterium]|nr:histidine--tRNA ligase [Phycisphaerales bacterium]
MTPPSPQPGRNHQAPRGTRDFYPIEMARRLWLEDKWRRTATRHGFDEISGPTFEHLDLYTVKSGEGIVSELFSFTREGGETAYALRPEFTPTLARMVAAKANALPKPIKWHSIGPYFRAERPQRGRLREFTQWNVDIIGNYAYEADPQALSQLGVESDAEIIACCIDALRAFGLTSEMVRVRLSDRRVLDAFLSTHGVIDDQSAKVISLLDARAKIGEEDYKRALSEMNIAPDVALGIDRLIAAFVQPEIRPAGVYSSVDVALQPYLDPLAVLWNHLRDLDALEWCSMDFSIVRGLAYYTGTVFEVHETGGKERAIAGGGRYDNLVELFGGPPTPAVGFAMGDVVIALVLQDKGLMPSDDAIARDMGLAPDVFVIASEEAADVLLRPVLAHLRRAGLHARRSYKSTRNVGKLLGEASKANARYALILKPDGQAELKDMGVQGGEPRKLQSPSGAEAVAAWAAEHIPKA